MRLLNGPSKINTVLSLMMPKAVISGPILFPESHTCVSSCLLDNLPMEVQWARQTQLCQRKALISPHPQT